MPDDKFQALLAELPSIAKVVNTFSSETTQVIALESLLSAFGVTSATTSSSPRKRSKTPKAPKELKEESKRERQSARSTSRRKEVAKLKVISDLNLHPEGKRSLSDFLKEKHPKKQPEQIAVIVYYLKSVLDLEKVSASHIYTCFKVTKELRIPGNTLQSLRNTSGREGWIDTSSMEEILLTAPGENYVEHDLPHKAK